MASVQAQLSKQFYQWEARGRGWQVFEDPVFPEPPFRPFFGHYQPAAAEMDDGCRPSFLESLFRRPPPPVLAEAEEEPAARILVREPLVELQTSLPAKLDISREAFICKPVPDITF